MEGRELVRAVLLAHRNGASFEPYPLVAIEPRLRYSGSVAVTGYRYRRALSHRDRPKVGLFDIRVKVAGEDLEHERSVILPAVSQLTPAMAESVFGGADPTGVAAEASQRLVLTSLQAAMAEQEVNWGSEPFQCKTYFAPPSRRTYDRRTVTSRPRDFLMGYVRKCFDIRGTKEWTVELEERIKEFLASCREHRASRSPALMPQMKGRYVHPEWERFHEDPGGIAEPWLWGDVLEEYREFAASAPDNPKYRAPNGR